MPITSIARRFLQGGRNLGQVAVPAVHAIPRNRGLQSPFSRAASVGPVSSLAGATSTISKQAKTFSELARSFLAIMRKNGHYTTASYPRKLTAVLSDRVPRACEFR